VALDFDGMAASGVAAEAVIERMRGDRSAYNPEVLFALERSIDEIRQLYSVRETEVLSSSNSEQIFRPIAERVLRALREEVA
jgi:hypothetical protein